MPIDNTFWDFIPEDFWGDPSNIPQELPILVYVLFVAKHFSKKGLR